MICAVVIVYLSLESGFTFQFDTNNRHRLNKRGVFGNDIPVVNNNTYVNSIHNALNPLKVPEVKLAEPHIPENHPSLQTPTNHSNEKVSRIKVSGDTVETRTTQKMNVSSSTVDIFPTPVHNNNMVPKIKSEDAIQSGALMRGFIVFVGLSSVVIVYFLFRSYRLRKNPVLPGIVQKYGIRANRTDMEMRPLPLDEDDDDDTFFDIGQQAR